MLQVNVARLHEDNREALALAWVAGRDGGTAVRREAVAAASLIGHLNLTHPNSIQVIGAYEAGIVAGFIERLLEPQPAAVPQSIDATLDLLAGADYVADRALATVLFLALRLGRPLFLEGEAGVGKTEIAKVLAAGLKRKLIRLQCYEGLDVASAVYEWNSAAQMIAIRLSEAVGETDRDQLTSDIFADRFLIKRPLLQALEPEVAGAPVLLIDEIDRADEAFEAYLLEILSDFQVTIPEFGTVKAPQPPIVIVTSNRTREIHDALKRRCFYYWVDYPNADRELEILKRKAPRASESLSREVVEFVQKLRKMDLFKLPGIAETIDWTEALMQLDALELAPQAINDTLGVLLKYQDDIARIQGSEAAKLLEQVKAEIAAAVREQ